MFVSSLVQGVCHGNDSVEEEMTLESLSMVIFRRLGQGEESWVSEDSLPQRFGEKL